MPWHVAGYETDADKPFDQGSFGTVWLARRTTDGARVALKLVLRDHAADAAERIEAERRGAMLQRSFHDAHGMVPAVYDIGHDRDGDLFIAMEFVEGGALSDALARGPLPADVAARHALAICRFLEKAHCFSTTIEGERYDRLVHADLKPGHIFLRGATDVIVLDFGIAKALHKATPLTTNNWGTSAYMSPERLLDGRVDEYVDFWSLGVILYEMLAGHRPYRQLQAPALKPALERAIRHNAPREALPSPVPPGLAAVVDKLLAYQPERRYPTAAAIADDLQAFLDGRPTRALAEYDTPATVRVAPATEPRSPDRPDTVGAGASDSAPVPPTDALPFAPPPLPAIERSQSATVPPAPVSRASTARPGRLRRVARVAVVLFALWSVIAETTAWLQAERFRARIGALEGPDLASAEASYDRLAATGPLHLGVRLRVDAPLHDHLVALGQRVIDDYRHEAPSLTLANWRQAQQALRWALRLEPGDRVARARLETCEAHILRIATRPGRSAGSQEAYHKAVERFRTAARLDPDSFDPYLGISRVAIYGLVPADVDLASGAMLAAETRGYTPGRRERAQLGDGYLRRADALRKDAATLSGPQRTHALERARHDYQACIDALEPIVGFGNAARHIETCKAQRDRVAEDLARATPASTEPGR